MAITYGFFNSVESDRKYNADQMSEYFDGLISDGLYESVGDAMQVVAASGMTVNVKTGRAIVHSKWIKNDSVLNLEITEASALLNRYTAIVLRYDASSRSCTITTKDGTPAAIPATPALEQTDSVFEYALAYVYVAAGSTQTNQANIADMRGSQDCPWITGIVKQVDTSTLFLQYQTAYQQMLDSMLQWQENQQAAYDSWFSTLTSELVVNTYIHKYEKTVTNTTSTEQTINLDMTGYEYSDGDVIMVYINGLLGIEGTNYTQNQGSITLTLSVTRGQANTIHIIALKSKIGDPSGGGGNVINQFAITNGISSETSLSGSGEVN